MRERLEKDAQEAAAREARTSPKLSLKGGTFTLGGQNLGQRIITVVVDAVFENAYYDPTIPYQEDNPMPPVCYAYARDSKQDMRPHESMQNDRTWFKPQSAWDSEKNWPGLCSSCPMNEWGSQPGRKGKACKNRETLTIIPAGYFQPPKPRAAPDAQLFTDPAHFAKADSVGITLPVTSGVNWAMYVTQVASAHRLPPYAVYTEMFIEPDPKSQYKVKFDMLGQLPEELFDVVTRRVDAAKDTPFEGYSPPDQRAPFETQGFNPRGRR
jgi:hypothetical protein